MAHTEAPARSRTRSTRTEKAHGQAVQVAPNDVLAVANDVATNVLVERGPEMRVIVLGALSGRNIHQLGPAGTAKSLGLREFCRRIEGVRYFEKAVHALMPADAIIGGYDMANFARTGEFARNVEHYAPNSHVVFIDEITRANGPTLDALLPMWNAEERRAEANGGMFQTPIMFAVSASNFMPDPDDPHLGALVDRLGLMQLVEYVKADDSFKEMFRRHHARTTGGAGSEPQAKITLDQLIAAQAQVRQVQPSGEFLDKYAELRRNTRAEGLGVSDRTWMELGLVARASAWLAGRDTLIPEDLAAIEPGLWRDKADIPTAHKLVLPFHGRFERDAAKYRQEAAAAFEKVEEIRPLVEGTPPGEELEQDVVTKAISASRKIATVKRRVDKLLGEAEAEKRDAAAARDLSNELRATQEWFKANDLPHNMDD